MATDSQDVESQTRNHRNAGSRRSLRVYLHRLFSLKTLVKIAYYLIWCPIWYALWPFTMFCCTGRRPFSSGWCATTAMKQGQQQRFKRRQQRVNPRSLYRLKDAHDIIDEGAIGKRRRLSISSLGKAQRSRFPLALAAALTKRKAEEPRIRQRSGLLALPKEIRVMIWQHAVGNRTIHILYGAHVRNPPLVFPLTATLFPIRIRRAERCFIRRFMAVECVHRPTPYGWENLHPYPLKTCCTECGLLWGRSFGDRVARVEWTGISACKDWAVFPSKDEMGKPSLVPVRSEWRPLTLLCACRLIYTEAVEVLYKSNTFYFPLPFGGPKAIVDFSRTILTQRLHRITSVSVPVTLGFDESKFEHLCRVLIEGFPGLRQVELRAVVLQDTDLAREGDVDRILSDFVRKMREKGVRIKLSPDVESCVSPNSVSFLPEGLEFVTISDEEAEKTAMIGSRLKAIGRDLEPDFGDTF